MELIARVLYRCPEFDLQFGQSTADLDIKVADEKKRQMLSDFPDWFEVVQAAGKLETPEDRLDIETVGRARKK